MTLSILNPTSLAAFTTAIRSGFEELGLELRSEGQAEAHLLQIHGSPISRQEDEEILQQSLSLRGPCLFLIHRPDELLLNQKLRTHFETHPELNLVFLGDLIFRDPFWSKRRGFSSVLAHPHLDLTLPPQTRKPVVGAFTTWGELRDIKHFIELAHTLRPSQKFEFRVGGPGLNRQQIPDWIEFSTEPFVAHFNVQLYHLNGKKRWGESSGSLHRGVSIPLLFEANGAERLEGFHAIKIEADEDLRVIQYEKAAREILHLDRSGLETHLQWNLKRAEENGVFQFAQKIGEKLKSLSLQKTSLL